MNSNPTRKVFRVASLMRCRARHASGVASGPRQACDKAHPDGIGSAHRPSAIGWGSPNRMLPSIRHGQTSRPAAPGPRAAGQGPRRRAYQGRPAAPSRNQPSRSPGWQSTGYSASVKARTSAVASGAAFSSGVALMKQHGGLPGGADSTCPRLTAAPSRARPSYRCHRSGSGSRRTIGGSGRKLLGPRDVRVGSLRWPPDAPGNTPGR